MCYLWHLTFDIGPALVSGSGSEPGLISGSGSGSGSIPESGPGSGSSIDGKWSKNVH